MLGWTLATIIGLVAWVAVALIARRQRMQLDVLQQELLALRDCVERSLFDLREVYPCKEDEILDQIEDDDSRMDNNLGRLNLLLDQLNGLLQGRDVDRGERRRIMPDDDVMLPFAGLLDFSGLDEWRKIEDLPPISDGEIGSIDWDLLYKRIQTDKQS